MKAEDKPRLLKESRALFSSIDIEKLIANPNDLEQISKINRLIAIFTNFSSNDGQELKQLFSVFQKWARSSTSIGTIRNRGSDVMQFIGQKNEEMDLYIIEEPELKQRQARVVKELENENLHVRSVAEGKDMHVFISEKGKSEHVHLVFDLITGEIRVDAKDQAPLELVEKVVSITTKSGSVIEATFKDGDTSLQFQEKQSTPSELPVIYVSSLRTSGGPTGQFILFTIKNISQHVAIDIKWQLRGFAYEWLSSDDPFELDSKQEKEVTFTLSTEEIYTKTVSELNIVVEYRDAMNRAYFTRRELKQELVPSGSFYTLKLDVFHPPSIIIDDNLELISGPTQVGDRDEAGFSTKTSIGQQNIKIGISRTLSSIWGFTEGNQLKQALLELGHRKIRRMIKESNLQDHLFTTMDCPEGERGGIEGYIRLRDSI